jgi:hypothetical protein
MFFVERSSTIEPPPPNLEMIVSPVRERAKVPAHFLHLPHRARATVQLQFYNSNFQFTIYEILLNTAKVSLRVEYE